MFQSNAVVALLDSAIIPPRTKRRLAKIANSKIGMIEQCSGITNDAKQGFSLACAMVKPDQLMSHQHVLKSY
jgi:hypothetical protein